MTSNLKAHCIFSHYCRFRIKQLKPNDSIIKYLYKLNGIEFLMGRYDLSIVSNASSCVAAMCIHRIPD